MGRGGFGAGSTPLAGVQEHPLRPAKGPGRTIFELAPLLDSADGSKRIDPKRERGDRVATLSTRGDPRGMLPASRLASLSPG